MDKCLLEEDMLGNADAKELENWLEEIDQYNSTPGDGTTRAVYTKEFMDARQYVKSQMEAAGLKVREDCLGNLFGELVGSDPWLAPVWTGSHIDTVPSGGKYDGLAGVFAGLEACKMISKAELKHKRTISVNVYAGEEMSRFGMCCIGSRGLAGRITPEDLKKSCDPEGNNIYDALSELGLGPEDFEDQFPQRAPVHASLELHIEQNSVLEKAGIPVGIVGGICAPTNMLCTVTGVQSHAGGTSMSDRKDAYMAAAEISLALEKLARESDSVYITGTVGEMRLTPNAANVIPGKAEFTIDIRSISREDKNALVAALKDQIAEISEKRGVKVDLVMLNNDKPVVCDPHLREILTGQAGAKNIPCMELISGPYHDSLLLGDFTKVGMIFIPCKDGISHDKAEAIQIEDLRQGTEVLANGLYQLANE